MTRGHNLNQLAVREEIVAAPSLPSRACEDRTFEFPPAVHVAMAGLFLAFVTILSATFATPRLAIPYAVFAFFILAFFTVPGLWTRMKPEDSRTPALSWKAFSRHGIGTMTGRTGATEAIVLVLLLPSLIVMWSVAIAIIAHVIR